MEGHNVLTTFNSGDNLLSTDKSMRGLGFFLRIYTLEDKGAPVAITAYHAQKTETGYFLLWSGGTGTGLGAGGLGSVCDFPINGRKHKALHFLLFLNNPYAVHRHAFKSLYRESHTNPQWF